MTDEGLLDGIRHRLLEVIYDDTSAEHDDYPLVKDIDRLIALARVGVAYNAKLKQVTADMKKQGLVETSAGYVLGLPVVTIPFYEIPEKPVETHTFYPVIQADEYRGPDYVEATVARDFDALDEQHLFANKIAMLRKGDVVILRRTTAVWADVVGGQRADGQFHQAKPTYAEPGLQYNVRLNRLNFSNIKPRNLGWEDKHE